MSSKTPSANNIAHAKRTVQQLRIEASIERIKVREDHAGCCIALQSCGVMACVCVNHMNPSTPILVITDKHLAEIADVQALFLAK